MSSKQIVFLDTEVSKGPRFIQGKILNMFKHILSQQKHSNTRITVETLRLLPTNTVKESFELKKKEFLTRLIERGYPRELVETVLVEVRFESRKTALQNKPKTSKKDFAFHDDFQSCYSESKKDSYETLASYYRQQHARANISAIWKILNRCLPRSKSVKRPGTQRDPKVLAN